MIESEVYGESNCEEDMRFYVCDGICWEVLAIIVGFGDEVVVVDKVESSVGCWFFVVMF